MPNLPTWTALLPVNITGQKVHVDKGGNTDDNDINNSNNNNSDDSNGSDNNDNNGDNSNDNDGSDNNNNNNNVAISEIDWPWSGSVWVQALFS